MDDKENHKFNYQNKSIITKWDDFENRKIQSHEKSYIFSKILVKERSAEILELDEEIIYHVV